MPLVIVQACRSWTSTTPGIAEQVAAHVVEVEARRRDLEQDRRRRPCSRNSDRGRISTAISSEAIESAR